MLKKLSVVTFDAFLSVAGTPPTRRSYLLPKAPLVELRDDNRVNCH
jgi:hypothetical protein